MPEASVILSLVPTGFLPSTRFHGHEMRNYILSFRIGFSIGNWQLKIANKLKRRSLLLASTANSPAKL